MSPPTPSHHHDPLYSVIFELLAISKHCQVNIALVLYLGHINRHGGGPMLPDDSRLLGLTLIPSWLHDALECQVNNVWPIYGHRIWGSVGFAIGRLKLTPTKRDWNSNTTHCGTPFQRFHLRRFYSIPTNNPQQCKYSSGLFLTTTLSGRCPLSKGVVHCNWKRKMCWVEI